jgi:hypothetical protein
MQGRKEEGNVADEFGAGVRRLGKARRRGHAARTQKDLAGRVAREFQEMRGLSLSAAQATRLFSIEQAECEQILETLVGRGVLRRTREGRYRPSSVDRSRS